LTKPSASSSQNQKYSAGLIAAMRRGKALKYKMLVLLIAALPGWVTRQSADCVAEAIAASWSSAIFFEINNSETKIKQNPNTLNL